MRERDEAEQHRDHCQLVTLIRAGVIQTQRETNYMVN